MSWIYLPVPVEELSPQSTFSGGDESLFRQAQEAYDQATGKGK